jgi:formylmethanofuran dehydrogenase subunit E
MPRPVQEMPRRIVVHEVHCEYCGEPMQVVKGSWPDQERLCNFCATGRTPWQTGEEGR